MTFPYEFGKFDRCTMGAKAYRFIKHDAASGDYYFAAEGADDYVEIIHQNRLCRLIRSPDWRHDSGYYDPAHRRGGRNAETRLALVSLRHKHHTVFSHYVAGCLHLEIQQGTATLSDASLVDFRKRLQRRLAENPTNLRQKLGGCDRGTGTACQGSLVFPRCASTTGSIARRAATSWRISPGNPGY